MTKYYSKLIGTGSYLPSNILTNKDLEKRVDTSDEWIRSRTGITQRHIVSETESTLDLSEAAAKKAIEMAGIDPKELGLIIVATTTPDRIFPSTACLLQGRLGNTTCPAFDLQAVCAGFIYGLSVADQFIRSGTIDYALVIGAEAFSRIVDWSDRSTCVLFGDGAGAVVLKRSDSPGLLSTHIHADGRYEDLLNVPYGVGRSDMEVDKLLPSDHKVKMRGNEVFRMAVKTLGDIVDETLAANGLTKESIDWLVPHQANIRIIQATAKKLKMPLDRVVVTVDKHGNTSAASVPLALDVAVRDGRIQPGQIFLMEAFGGGFTWGSALCRF